MDKTDKELLRLEKKIDEIYRRAIKELAVKWKDYVDKTIPEVDMYRKKYEKTRKKYGWEDPKTQRRWNEYNTQYRRIIITRMQYLNMGEDLSKNLTKVNQIASDYLNDKLPLIYTLNYNRTAEVCGEKIGYAFAKVNERVIRDLILKDNDLLPKSTVNVVKDMMWNKKKINAELLQGILQGESADQISNRFENIVGMNRNSRIRNRRTMVTAAQNKGREDQMKDQVKQGIRVQKEWLATQDGRTRHSHAMLDGERVDIDEKFSNGLMYPGDPNGSAAEVYNCRCTMVYFYPDFEN